MFNLPIFKSSFKRSYTLKDTLGKGGYGTVSICTRRSDNKTFSAKIIRKDKKKTLPCGTPSEVFYLSKCHHPNIIPFLGFYKTRNTWVILTEYSPHYMDLHQFIAIKGPLSSLLTLSIFQQLISALQHCFTIGIDHRDVKDENVLINTRTLKIKLIDFGAAAPHDLIPYNNGSCTGRYLPPEFWRSGFCETYCSTVWALGCLMFKMCTGKAPFDHAVECARNVVDAVSLSMVDESLRSLVMLMLEPNPRKRLQWKALCGIMSTN